MTATGGSGGSGAVDGAAGAATATGAVTGVHSVSLQVNAYAGPQGATSGTATASSTATGQNVTSDAAADGGAGISAAGKALATAIGSATVNGAVDASAHTALQPGVLVQDVHADASEGGFTGTGRAVAEAQIGAATPAFVTNLQAVAYATGEPSAANVSAVLSANPHIATAFGASASYFAIGELGGAPLASSAGGGSNTSTTSLSVQVDLTHLANRQDLMVGLYHPVAVGTHVTDVYLDIQANGTDLLHQDFPTAAAAVHYFTDHAFDFGSLAHTSSLGASDTLNVTVTLSVTSSAPGSGFDAGILIGDPPPSDGESAAFGWALAENLDHAGHYDLLL